MVPYRCSNAARAAIARQGRPCCCQSFRRGLLTQPVLTSAAALTAHDFHSYEFHKVWGGSKEEGLAKLEEFVLTEDFARLDPIPDAAATLHELASHFRFIVVTARHLFLADKTKAWLEAHYPGVFDDVLMSNVYGREGVKR